MITKNDLKIFKSLKIKKYRIREGKFLVEGLKNVKVLLQSDFVVEKLLCTKEYAKHFEDQLYDIISSDQLNSISTLSNNQSCVAVAKIVPFTEHDLQFDDHIILLDGVRDPGNLGTIIRSLDWFGCFQLVCSEDCADFYNPKTIAATMGSFVRVRVIYTDLVTLIANGPKMKRYGLTLNGLPLEEQQFGEPSMFLLGSESHGLSKQIINLVDAQLTIPRFGGAESLNVAMTASILLHQLRLGKI